MGFITTFSLLNAMNNGVYSKKSNSSNYFLDRVHLYSNARSLYNRFNFSEKNEITLDIVRDFLQKGVDFKYAQDDETLLKIAVRKNAGLDILQLLIDSGAEITINGMKEGTILHTAALSERADVVRMLLEKYRMDPNISCLNKDGETPLYALCAHIKDKKIKEEVLKKHKKEFDENQNNDVPLSFFGFRIGNRKVQQEEMPYHRYLLTENEQATFKTLIELGADPSIMHEGWKKTIMQFAVENDIPLDKIYQPVRLQKLRVQLLLDFFFIERYAAEREKGKLCFSKDMCDNRVVYVKKIKRNMPLLPLDIIMHIVNLLEDTRTDI